MKDGRKLDVVLHSATALRKESTSKMSVYAVAWIEPSVRVPSPIAKPRGTNPVWNATISIALDERALGQGNLYLNIELLGHGLLSTKRIGFVTVSLSDILLEGSNGAAVLAQFPAHPVTRRSGQQQGFLSFEVHLHHQSPNQGLISREHSTVSEPPPSKPQGLSIFDDDVVSPFSSPEDGEFRSKVPFRSRVYARRARSFSLTGLLTCH